MERKIDRSIDPGDLLSTLPPRVLDVTASDAAVYAAVRAWREENREAVVSLDLDAERFTAAMLATRALIRSGNDDAPLEYFAVVLRQPFDKWLREARRWLKARASPARTYTAHGVPP